MATRIVLLCLGVAAVAAFPQDLGKETPGLHFTQIGEATKNDASKYNPDRQNVYHLFTRQNPNVSQPLLMGNQGLLGITNFNSKRRNVLLCHGWGGSVIDNFNAVIIPALLSAEDVNVIVLDWSAGAGTINYFTAVANTVPAGLSVAKFVTWLNTATGAVPAMYHLIGHNLGGHLIGVVGRQLQGQIAYITALDPSFVGWSSNDEKLRASDAVYTEVIHTNVGFNGYIAPLGDTDFYPNGGSDMPGCDSHECDHARSYYYMAESLRTGGFTGQRCLTHIGAMAGNCNMWGTLRMGGLVPKTGQTGIYYLKTNRRQPFSRG